MYSFLFLATTNGCEVVDTLKRSKDIIQTELPSLNCNIKSKELLIPEVNGGYYFFYPEQVAEKKRLVTDYSDKELSILVFGDIINPSCCTTAESIAEAWINGGIEAVRGIDGCFSAIIVDKIRKRIFVASDLMGLRTLNYYADEKTIVISMHDAVIVSTGLCSIDYDLTSIVSLLSCDWSIQGIPLIKQIHTFHPFDYILWDSGNVQTIRSPLLSVEGRIDPRDDKKIKSHVTQMIDVMLENISILFAGEEIVETDLTAGMDSRATLGLLLNVLGKERVRTFTSGASHSKDVSMARRLSRKYGLHHRHDQLSSDCSHSFDEHSRIITFYSNGIVNCKRATSQLPTFNLNVTPHISGNGGEIYHGFYYPKSIKTETIERFTQKQVCEYLKSRMPRAIKYQWISDELVNTFYERMSESLINYEAAISGNPFDLLNLFYLYERYCRWGCRVFRNVWVHHVYVLFNSTKLLRLAFQLPSPISQNHLLHRTIIKKYIPESYYWLINSSTFMPALDFPILSKGITLFLHKVRDFLNYLPTSPEEKTVEQINGDIFSVHLSEYIRDTLYSKNSLTSSVFNKQEVEKIVESHIERKEDNLQIIGFMITLEHYKRIMENISKKIISK